MSAEKIIAIGGGVGPMAGVNLHKKIIENTLTNGTDQDHIEVIHLSRSADITDRTKYLLGEEKINPAEGMLNSIKAAVKGAEVSKKEIVFGVPCNTFHAPEIFNRLIELISENNLNVKLINMLEETFDYIALTYPKLKKVGLMSTTGTRKLNFFNKTLEAKGYEVIEVPEEKQEKLHDSIYNTEWGIKAVTPVTKKARTDFLKYTDLIRQKGAEVVILGCTEIPLALPEKEIKGTPLIDPLNILARALVKEANELKLKK